MKKMVTENPGGARAPPCTCLLAPMWTCKADDQRWW